MPLLSAEDLARSVRAVLDAPKGAGSAVGRLLAHLDGGTASERAAKLRQVVDAVSNETAKAARGDR